MKISEQIAYWKNRFERTGSWEDRLQWQSLVALSERGLEKAPVIEKRKGKYRKPLNYAHGGRKPGTYTHSDETKRKISEKMRGKNRGVPKPADWKKKISEQFRGEGNPFYGRTPWNKGRKGIDPRSPEGRAVTCKPVLYKGRRYSSLAEAERKSGMPVWIIRRDGVQIAESP